MTKVTLLYWRDIPAQVIVGKGRNAIKSVLSERFETSIDRCAMRSGAKDSDAYLEEWRKAAPFEVEGDPQDVASAQAAQIEAKYDSDRLKQLINNDGWDDAREGLN